jgi:dTDP-glucose pyrophosphorylase
VAAWLDTGSIDDFYKTSSFVSALENRQGLENSLPRGNSFEL